MAKVVTVDFDPPAEEAAADKPYPPPAATVRFD